MKKHKFTICEQSTEKFFFPPIRLIRFSKNIKTKKKKKDCNYKMEVDGEHHNKSTEEEDAIRCSRRRSSDPSDVFADYYRREAAFEFSAGTSTKVSYRDTVMGGEIRLQGLDLRCWMKERYSTMI